jgi:hypothetical protein
MDLFFNSSDFISGSVIFPEIQPARADRNGI